jgi:hypothetical protein
VVLLISPLDSNISQKRRIRPSSGTTTSDSKDQSRQKQKTNISVSIDSNLLNEIRRESESKDVSLNARINTILAKHATFYRHSEEQQSIVLPNRTFRSIVNTVDEDLLLNEFKENNADLIPTIFNQRNIPLTLSNLIEYCYKRIAIVSGTFHDFSSYKDNEGHLCMVVRHNYGIKWSRVLAAGLSHQIESAVGYHVISASVLSSSILLKIVEKDIS